jgi:RNA polymerase sigma factor (sigma-70 family)
MEFAPHDVRLRQLTAAEDLLNLIEPARAYPLDFVIFKITEYRPKETDQELLTGIALQHDLGLLIEQVSNSLNLHAAALDEPVLDIEDVCERFNVTSKTIQRWRRKGLAARRFLFADGKRRVGFLLGSVERFIGSHQRDVASANLSQLDDDELGLMVRHARRLAGSCGCTVDEITRRIAARTRRSPLTILHTLRRHEQLHPHEAVFAAAALPVSESDRAAIASMYRRGATPAELAARFARPRCTVYRAILDERIARLLKRKTNFHDDPLYHSPDAAEAIDAIVRQEELADPAGGEELRILLDLPPYLRDLYRTPLLTRSRERALFLKLNFHKYQFVSARRHIDLEKLRARDLRRLEGLLAMAGHTKNQIVAANLRLVVSVARKHLRPSIGLLELVSEGNLILMRAVDGFDIHRGHRFSTYATFALMKGFARLVPHMLGASRHETPNEIALANAADPASCRSGSTFIDREELRELLLRLDDRERNVLTAHYGLGGEAEPATYEQVGQRMGLSKERVRQIEQTALAKLRNSSHDHVAV